VRIPQKLQLRLNNETTDKEMYYLTKTMAAPGDDDDYHSAMQLISGWHITFLDKTKEIFTDY